MSAGSFICAALPAANVHIKNAIKTNPNDIDELKINKFLLDNTNKFLCSLGVVLLKKGYKVDESLLGKFDRRFLGKFNKAKYLENCELSIDSAGYQIQQGYLEREEIPKWIDLFYDRFIPEYGHRISKAFMVDIAPGFTFCPYKSFKDIRDLNVYSYEKAKSYSTELKEKLIYVHHFRTPNLHNIYNEMLFDLDLADGIKNFATGGLVSFGTFGKDIPPYVMYVVPLLEIIHYCLNKKIKKFRFHVLGGAEWKEMLGHKFFEKHVKEIFDIDLEITFDSSTFFKTMCMGRYAFNPTNNRSMRKMSIRPADLDTILDDNGNRTGITHKQRFFELLNDAVSPYGMTPLNNEDPMYECSECGTGYNSGFCSEARTCPKCGVMDRETFPNLIYAYGMMQIFKCFKMCEEWHSAFVEEIYPDLNRPDKFNSEVQRYLVNLHCTPRPNMMNVSLKAVSIYNSLNLMNEYLENPEYALSKCRNLVTRYMSKDEHDILKDDGCVSVFDVKQEKKLEMESGLKRVRKPKPDVVTF